ncbi:MULTISPECIES: hypothetical protein [unclassified Duganella]|uniref:hypothetical protein n=1 Tax=unclassified Duganella TaxID=2636909 RepID=UPI0006FC43DA|nr:MULTISPECIES: hypothetical protein [unclassified Duganella]KQV45526.1 hypothetical protein ASD07_18640 [Duganella sp. Root336D2]KRC00788.1 hypothetical protein ASE26_22570 [Duganella sp. Root198D2]
MKPRHMLMGAALLCAAALVLFGDKAPNDTVAEAVERKPARAPAASAPPAVKVAHAAAGETSILRLVPREELIGEVGEGSFKSKDGVFGGQNWNPPPPPPTAAELKPPPPPPPTAPPLPFQFLGKAAADGQWEVYLGRGEQTFVVKKGMQIDGTYRVDAIAPPTLTMTYLPMNQVQQLNIGVIE